jgi:hypothetical protein
MIPHPLADDLVKSVKRRASLMVRPATPAEMGSFEAKEADCHRNVERWILDHPRHRHARGWLVMPGGHFVRHSVVQFEDGRLVEITYVDGTHRRFIWHDRISQLPFDDLPPQICRPIPADLRH